MILKGDGFEIRPLTACKLDAAVQVYRQSNEGTRRDPQQRISGQNVLEDMTLSRQDGGIFCGIYDQEDELAGVLDFVPANFAGRSDNACIRSLKIAAPYRNRGLGGRAIDRLEEELRKDIHLKYLWACFPENCSTWQEFAARHGFRQAGKVERSQIESFVEVTWVKNLT